MDHGIPTEAVLEELRRSDPQVSYLMGTPKSRLTQLEKELAEEVFNFQQSRRPDYSRFANGACPLPLTDNFPTLSPT